MKFRDFVLLFVLLIVVNTQRVTQPPRESVDANVKFQDFDRQDVTNKPKELTTIKESGIEIEENLIDSGRERNPLKKTKDSTRDSLPTPSDSVTATIAASVPMCSMDVNTFNQKVSKLIEKFVPEQLILKQIESGTPTKIALQNGILNVNKNFKVVGQPSCTEMEDKTKQYEIMISFSNLMGSYEYKIYSLFGYNFTETAMIRVKQVITDLTIGEKLDQKTGLLNIEVGKIDGIVVNVNIPSELPMIASLKSMVEYVISKIKTLTANTSLDSIVTNMKDNLERSIRDKVKINP